MVRYKPKPYLNPKTELKKTKDKGLGLFAKNKIKAGELIYIHDGKIIVLKESKKLTKKQQNLCYDIDDSRVFCPRDFNKLTPDWHTNHSCNPNCGSTFEHHGLIAMRDIRAGEEITYDYVMGDEDPEWSMVCRCGSENCRKIITGNDWKIPELQKRYQGYFQKNIQAKIDLINKKQC